MSVAVPTTVRRWLVPSAAALAVIAGGVAIGLVTNAADQAPPPRSAEDLLVGLQTAQVDGLQGTVTFRADLGLPPLPVPSVGSADLGSLATGTHTLRVWYADPGQARVALIGRDGETDVIVNGDEVWVWSSKEQEAVHGTLPEGGLAALLGGDLLGGAPLPSGAPMALPGGLDPQTVARLVLTFLEQFETDVTTDSNANVAGRAAYELTIAPRDTRSLVKSIILNIDAETNLPLRLAVLAREGGAPAFEVGFTELSLTRPDPAQFEFNPPPGTTVVEADEVEMPAPLATTPFPDVMPSFDEDSLQPPRFATVGTGWTTVVVVRPDLPDAVTDGSGEGPSLPEMLALLPKVSGDWGSGTLLRTKLFSVLFTDDGRLLAGAVAPDVLYAAAADPAAQLES
jgi:outer membrane lipoprotein-sorting protein